MKLAKKEEPNEKNNPKLKMSSLQTPQVAVYLLASDVATHRTAKVMSLF